MDNKRIVVALGRNAFGETFPEQQANVKKAARAIADLVEAKYEIVITHSNGPQVGMIHTAMAEFCRIYPWQRTVLSDSSESEIKNPPPIPKRNESHQSDFLSG